MRLIIFIFFLISNGCVFGQNSVDSDFFRLTCFKLNDINEKYILLKKYFNVYSDGTDGFIDTMKTISSEDLAKLKLIEKDDVFKLLASDKLGFLPIKKNIYILDTIDFFSKEHKCNVNGNIYKVDKVKRKRKHYELVIYNFNIKNDKFILTYLNKSKKIAQFNCYFRIINNIELVNYKISYIPKHFWEIK